VELESAVEPKRTRWREFLPTLLLLMVAWCVSSPASLLSANVATSFVSDREPHYETTKGCREGPTMRP